MLGTAFPGDLGRGRWLFVTGRPLEAALATEEAPGGAFLGEGRGEGEGEREEGGRGVEDGERDMRDGMA